MKWLSASVGDASLEDRMYGGTEAGLDPGGRVVEPELARSQIRGQSYLPLLYESHLAPDQRQREPSAPAVVISASQLLTTSGTCDGGGAGHPTTSAPISAGALGAPQVDTGMTALDMLVLVSFASPMLLPQQPVPPHPDAAGAMEETAECGDFPQPSSTSSISALGAAATQPAGSAAARLLHYQQKRQRGGSSSSESSPVLRRPGSEGWGSADSYAAPAAATAAMRASYAAEGAPSSPAASALWSSQPASAAALSGASARAAPAGSALGTGVQQVVRGEHAFDQHVVRGQGNNEQQYGAFPRRRKLSGEAFAAVSSQGATASLSFYSRPLSSYSSSSSSSTSTSAAAGGIGAGASFDDSLSHRYYGVLSSTLRPDDMDGDGEAGTGAPTAFFADSSSHRYHGVLSPTLRPPSGAAAATASSSSSNSSESGDAGGYHHSERGVAAAGGAASDEDVAAGAMASSSSGGLDGGGGGMLGLPLPPAAGRRALANERNGMRSCLPCAASKKSCSGWREGGACGRCATSGRHTACKPSPYKVRRGEGV